MRLRRLSAIVGDFDGDGANNVLTLSETGVTVWSWAGQAFQATDFIFG